MRLHLDAQMYVYMYKIRTVRTLELFRFSQQKQQNTADASAFPVYLVPLSEKNEKGKREGEKECEA